MENLPNTNEPLKKPEIESDNRFSGTAGEEYDLLLLAYPHYAELQSTVGRSITETFKNRVIPEIQVLEIGCGTGITSKVLLDSDKRIKLTALDNEQIMLDQAKEKLVEYATEEKVEFVLSDVLKYLEQKPDASLDAVTSVFVLHNFKSDFREKVIKEIFRVLKKDGIFVNGDKFALDDEQAHTDSYDKQIKEFDKYDAIGRTDYKNHWVEHFKEDNAPDVIFKEGEAMEMLKKIGFKDVQLIYREAMEATIAATK